MYVGGSERVPDLTTGTYVLLSIQECVHICGIFAYSSYVNACKLKIKSSQDLAPLDYWWIAGLRSYSLILCSSNFMNQ